MKCLRERSRESSDGTLEGMIEGPSERKFDGTFDQMFEGTFDGTFFWTVDGNFGEAWIERAIAFDGRVADVLKRTLDGIFGGALV